MTRSNSPRRGPACILVVEDNDGLRQSICQVFSESLSGVVVAEACSCEEAVRMLLCNMPDIIVTDIRLPGESGLVLTEMVKSAHPFTPVIIHTHYNMREYRDAADALGADHFLVKGKVHLDQLCRLVAEFLD